MKLGDTDDFMESEQGMDFLDNLDAMVTCTGTKFQNLGDIEDKPNAEA